MLRILEVKDFKLRIILYTLLNGCTAHEMKARGECHVAHHTHQSDFIPIFNLFSP